MLVFSSKERAIEHLRGEFEWPREEPVAPVWDEKMQAEVAVWVLPHAIAAHYQNRRTMYEQRLAVYEQRMADLAAERERGYEACFAAWVQGWIDDGDLAELEVR